MAVWSGLGVNYKGATATWSADQAYFNSIGLKYIRLHMDPVPYPWAQSGMQYFRDAAVSWSNAGFQVNFGPACATEAQTASSMTATAWSHYHDSVVAEATYCQSIGLKLFCFELGNELEPKCDGSTLTVDQFIINMKQLATDVKAVYNLGAVGYSAWDFNGTTYPKWVTAGLGNIDYFFAHPYANITTNGKSITLGGFDSRLSTLKSALGSKCQISEFNIDAGNTNLLNMPDSEKIVYMRQLYKIIKDLNFSAAHVYSFVGYKNQDDQFAMRNNDGSYSPQWCVLLADNKRLTYTN